MLIICLFGNSDIFVMISFYNSVGEVMGCSVFFFFIGLVLLIMLIVLDGLSQVCVGEIELYLISLVSGVDIYSWFVIGGNIIVGQGFIFIIVNWIDGIGMVCVSVQN